MKQHKKRKRHSDGSRIIRGLMDDAEDETFVDLWEEDYKDIQGERCEETSV